MFLNKSMLGVAAVAMILSGCSFDLTEQGIRRAEQLNRVSNSDVNKKQCTEAGGKLEVRDGTTYCKVPTYITSSWDFNEE